MENEIDKLEEIILDIATSNTIKNSLKGIKILKEFAIFRAKIIGEANAQANVSGNEVAVAFFDWMLKNVFGHPYRSIAYKDKYKMKDIPTTDEWYKVFEIENKKATDR